VPAPEQTAIVSRRIDCDLVFFLVEHDLVGKTGFRIMLWLLAGRRTRRRIARAPLCNALGEYVMTKVERKP
jgi:hypothetical protein